jgi:hypothetical protein
MSKLPLIFQVKALIDKIYAVPDGMGGNRRPFKVDAESGGCPGSFLMLSVHWAWARPQITSAMYSA